MRELYPALEPYDEGMLDVGDGNLVYWETSGNPSGKPAVLLHGGPGQGSAPSMRRGFDPQRYRIVLFDQRGCGRSTPNAADPGTDMRFNTTGHLLADMEQLRKHLGIDRWMLTGGSWGCTLALAYAERYPHLVSEIVLSAVTTSRRVEADWLYYGAARFFPGEWAAFRDEVPVGDRADLFHAYARLMQDPDPSVREHAAIAWCAWEDAVLSLEPLTRPHPFSDRPSIAMMAMVRICAHYLAHGAWLAEGALIRDAGRLAGIPAVLIHGRLDLSCPFDTAWELARAWPGVELHALPDSGHLGTAARRELTVETLDRFVRSGTGQG